MNAETVASDQAWSVEQHAIEPIPESDRHGGPWELFRMWVGANVNYLVVVTGSLAVAQGLSFRDSLTAIVLGNLVGCAVVGLCSVMGPRTGSAGIVGSRASFGQLGAALPMIVSVVSALSWFSIQSVVATQSLQAIGGSLGMNGPVVGWACLLLVLGAEIALAVYGHATIIAAEKWIALALALLFAGLGALVLPRLGPADFSAGGTAGLGQWLAVAGIMAAYPIAWANFASDYSRYLPSRTGWGRIALCAGLGQFVALVACEVVGVLYGMALHGALGNDPITQLGSLLPGWYLVPFLAAVVLGGIAANVPNGYTAALGMLALRLPVTRLSSLAIIAVFTLGIRILTVVFGHFYDLYEGFLGYLVYWTAPWAAIVITDHFLRGQSYDRADLMRWGSGAYWYERGIFWPGVAAFVLGVFASVLCSNSETYASPLAKALFGTADLSIPAGLAVPALAYHLLARRSLREPRVQPA